MRQVQVTPGLLFVREFQVGRKEMWGVAWHEPKAAVGQCSIRNRLRA